MNFESCDMLERKMYGWNLQSEESEMQYVCLKECTVTLTKQLAGRVAFRGAS